MLSKAELAAHATEFWKAVCKGWNLELVGKLKMSGRTPIIFQLKTAKFNAALATLIQSAALMYRLAQAIYPNNCPCYGGITPPR